MSKPTALTDAEIKDIETRLEKGWVVRRDQQEALCAMARERNALVAAASAPVLTVSSSESVTITTGSTTAGGSIWNIVSTTP